MKSGRAALNRFIPYPNNPRFHPPEEIALLAEILKMRGPDQPIVVDESWIILKGHGRLDAAKIAGLKDFPFVQRLGLSEADKMAMRIEDNQLPLLASWNIPLLQSDVQALKLSGYDVAGLLGFPQEMLASYGFNVGETAFPELKATDRPAFQQMTFTLHDSPVEIVKAALDKAKKGTDFKGSPNENSNGNALAAVCRNYQRQGNPRGANKTNGRKRHRPAASLQRKNSSKQPAAPGRFP